MERIQKIVCSESKQGSSKIRSSYNSTSENNLDTSFRLIKTHSEPNLRSHIIGSEMEDMVSKLCISSDESVELNNTFDVIDYILKHGPDKANNDPVLAKTVTLKSCQNTPAKDIIRDEQSSPGYFTPLQTPTNNIATPFSAGSKLKTPIFNTPANNNNNTLLQTPVNNFATPISNGGNLKSSTFKTPVNPVQYKPATPRGTPGKINSYQHISSPIASYIKHSPQVPLVKDIHPKKPLPGISGIPKSDKISQSKIPVTKHNGHHELPSVAYKCAKKTKVVQMPEEDKLPKSQWINKITSAIPKPTVMRHENRERDPRKKRLLSNQDLSFANLSFHQADVSICTQKTAFKSTNKH